MTLPTSISPEEAADRLAIRRLIDAYARCADRRDAQGQMALFTTDTVFQVFMDSRSAEPTQTLHGREALAPVFENLNTYQATTHFNGQSTVEIEGNTPAKGESYCIAHHLTVDGTKRTFMIASIRYLDKFTKAGRHLAVRRAQADGRLDRYAQLARLRTQAMGEHALAKTLPSQNRYRVVIRHNGKEVASYEIEGTVPGDAEHEAWRRYEADHWPVDPIAERYETNVEEL